MRLYDKQYDETDPNWWKSMRDRMQNMTENEYSDSYNTKLHKGKVVKYK